MIFLDLGTVITIAVTLTILIIAVWLIYKKAAGRIPVLLSWGRNFTVLEIAVSFVLWINKSVKTHSMFDSDLTTIMFFVNVLFLLLCIMFRRFYYIFNGQNTKAENPSGALQNTQLREKPYGTRNFYTFGLLSLTLLPLINLLNLYYFYTTFNS